MEAVFNQLFTTRGRKILCIGKNYIDHVKEMGGTAFPETPVVFLKPLSSVVEEGRPLVFPDTRVDHEVELGVLIGRQGRHIPEAESMDYVGGYFIALDMTAREHQNLAKEKGWPWSISKGFDDFCPLSKYIPPEQIPDPHNVEIELQINGETRQISNTAMMHFKIPYLISYLSSVMTLDVGDLILTGTPMGIGPVQKGDHLEIFARREGDEIMKATFDVSND